MPISEVKVLRQDENLNVYLDNHKVDTFALNEANQLDLTLRLMKRSHAKGQTLKPSQVCTEVRKDLGLLN